jgi:hypothetical protein
VYDYQDNGYIGEPGVGGTRDRYEQIVSVLSHHRGIIRTMRDAILWLRVSTFESVIVFWHRSLIGTLMPLLHMVDG